MLLLFTAASTSQAVSQEAGTARAPALTEIVALGFAEKGILVEKDVCYIHWEIFKISLQKSSKLNKEYMPWCNLQSRQFLMFEYRCVAHALTIS